MVCPLTDNNLFQQMAQEIPSKTPVEDQNHKDWSTSYQQVLNLASNTDQAVLRPKLQNVCFHYLSSGFTLSKKWGCDIHCHQ